MSDIEKEVMDAVRKVLAKLETTRTRKDTESIEATREAFRHVLRTLDKVTPWPEQYRARFDDIQKSTRKSLALFGHGDQPAKAEDARKSLEELLDY